MSEQEKLIQKILGTDDETISRFVQWLLATPNAKIVIPQLEQLYISQ